MANSQRFKYTLLKNTLGEVIPRPLLTVEMTNHGQSLTASGLLDSGADVNVLPYGLGVALGLVWKTSDRTIRLSGNLANFEAQGAVIPVHIGNLSTVNLAFVWTRAQQAPLIFGQTNFFEAFAVCFYRAESEFSVTQL